MIAVGRVCDAVCRLLVDLPLRVVRPDVTVVAGLRPTRLLQRELVAQVALLTLADGSVHGRLAHRVARLAREPGDVRPLQGEERVARLLGTGATLGDRLVLLAERGSERIGPGEGHVGGQAVSGALHLQRFLLVTMRAHGRRGRRKHPGAFVLDRAGMARLHLVAVPTLHVGCRHRAHAVLVDDAGRGVAVAGDAGVVAPCKGVDLAHFRWLAGAPDGADDRRESDHDDDDDEGNEEQAGMLQRSTTGRLGHGFSSGDEDALRPGPTAHEAAGSAVCGRPGPCLQPRGTHRSSQGAVPTGGPGLLTHLPSVCDDRGAGPSRGYRIPSCRTSACSGSCSCP